MKKLIFLAALVCLIGVSPGLAKPHFFGQLGASQCDPGAHRMVLNIVYQVTGDVDSGVAGNYWANDSYTKHIQVWDMDNGTFCVQAKYTGSFVTVAGTSPGDTGTIGSGITGTMEGGFSGTLTGASFTPAGKRTKGNIGSKDFECDILTGECPGKYPWITEYFTGGTFEYSFWGWTYDAGNNGTWANASTGNEGDIL